MNHDFTTSFLAAGAAAAVTTTAVVAWQGHRRDVSGWAPINAVSHIAWGDEAAAHVEPSLKYTATGAFLNAAAVISWAVVFEGVSRTLPHRNAASLGAVAAATAALAYAVDYHVVPRRLTPGFELRLPRRSFLPIYASLAAGLTIGSWLASRPRSGMA